MSIFNNIDISQLNIATEQQLQELLNILNATTLEANGFYTYSYKSNNTISYFLPVNTIILCDKTQVTPVTNNLIAIDSGYQVSSLGVTEILLKTDTPITII